MWWSPQVRGPDGRSKFQLEDKEDWRAPEILRSLFTRIYSVLQSGIISEINPEDSSTWCDRIFLTFDIDWANDDVISDTLGIVEAANVKATWFVTHETPFIGRLRSNSNFELGIHPNFNFLLNSDPRNGATAEEVVDRLLAIVPEAVSVRSHAMLQSTGLLDLFQQKGLTHDSNTFVPEQSGIELKPWRDWLGLTKVPYCWEDDIYCLSSVNTPIRDVMARPGLKVFDFHPIHVFLNTECMTRYDDSRAAFQDIPALQACRNKISEGTRTLLEQVLRYLK